MKFNPEHYMKKDVKEESPFIPVTYRDIFYREIEYVNKDAWKRASCQLWQRLQELAKSGKLKELNLII